MQTEMNSIVSRVTKEDAKEEEIIFNSRLPISKWECYEKAAKHYSQECFSIAKVRFLNQSRDKNNLKSFQSKSFGQY